VKKKLFILLLLAILLTGCSNDKGAIENTVKQFLGARWQLLQDYSIPLESFYVLSLPSAMVEVEKDKEIIKRHLIDPRNEAGIIVHSVKVDSVINNVSIQSNLAEVRATVELVEINEQIGEEKYTSKIANIEHDFSLVKKDDKWLIVTHKSHDMFTRIYDK
jgi:PBP1b-binding outer membrane lipoprotein LpoB